MVPQGEKCGISHVSNLSVLIDSLSNVLQQFKGAHANGADNVSNTQGARCLVQEILYSSGAWVSFQGHNLLVQNKTFSCGVAQWGNVRGHRCLVLDI